MISFEMKRTLILEQGKEELLFSINTLINDNDRKIDVKKEWVTELNSKNISELTIILDKLRMINSLVSTIEENKIFDEYELADSTNKTLGSLTMMFNKLGGIIEIKKMFDENDRENKIFLEKYGIEYEVRQFPLDVFIAGTYSQVEEIRISLRDCVIPKLKWKRELMSSGEKKPEYIDVDMLFNNSYEKLWNESVATFAFVERRNSK